MGCNQKMNEFKEHIEKERKNIKRSIFDNQVMQFEANISQIGEEFLGKLSSQKNYFTVVILILLIF